MQTDNVVIRIADGCTLLYKTGHKSEISGLSDNLSGLPQDGLANRFTFLHTRESTGTAMESDSDHSCSRSPPPLLAVSTNLTDVPPLLPLDLHNEPPPLISPWVWYVHVVCPLPSSSMLPSFTPTSLHNEHEEVEIDNERKPEPRCEECGRLFRSRAGLVQHIKTHQAQQSPNSVAATIPPTNPVGASLLKCDLCERTFKDPIKKHEHEDRDHKPQEFLCGRCEKTFSRKCQLDLHCTVCTGEVQEGSKYNNCKLCQKSYKKSSTLARHVDQVHKKIVQFACHGCGKMYYFRQHRDSHEITCLAKATNNYS